jgi:hypothetical protein
MMKKTREQLRNEYAENVCRELIYQISNSRYGEMPDPNTLAEHLKKWVRYAKKNKYERP